MKLIFAQNLRSN